MQKSVLVTLVSWGLFNAGASAVFACSCAIFESYGSLPSMQGAPFIFAGKVVGFKIASEQESDYMQGTAILDVVHVWKGTPVKTVLMSIPKQYRGCCEPSLFQWNYAKPLEKGKDYIFFSVQSDFPQSLGLAISIQQGQAFFAELGSIAGLESSNKFERGVNGVPLACHLQNLTDSAYNLQDRESGLFWLSYRYANIGDRATALQIADHIEDAGLRANILLALAAKKSDENRFDEAIQIVDNFPSSQYKDIFLQDEAIQIIYKLPPLKYKDVFLQIVVRQLVGTNHLDRALQIINKLKHSSHRRAPLEAVALKLIETKEYDRAQQLLVDASNFSKGYISMLIVHKYLENNNYNRALEIASNIEDQQLRDLALFAIGRKFALSGNFPRAIEIAHMANPVPIQINTSFAFNPMPPDGSNNYQARNKIEFLFQIADRAIKLGQYETALQIANNENNNDLNAAILMEIAAKYLDEGNTTRGDEFLKRSIEIASVPYRFQLARKATKFLDRLVLLNHYFSDRRRTIFNSEREEILVQFANSLLAKGKIEEARHVIQGISSEREKNNFQFSIVGKLIGMGRYDEALQLNYRLKDRWMHDRLSIILDISSKYTESGNRDKSLQSIQTAIKFASQQNKNTDNEPVSEYLLISGHAQKLGFDDIALQVAQKLSLYWQIMALQGLAANYIEKGNDRRAFEMLEILEKGMKQRIEKQPEQKEFLQQELSDRRNSFFLKLVKREIAAKNYDLALTNVTKMTDKFNGEYNGQGMTLSSHDMQKTLFLTEIALHYARSGDFENAIQATSKISHIQTRERIWEAIAFERSSSGNYQEAIAIANRILDRTNRSKLSNLLTCAQQHPLP